MFSKKMVFGFLFIFIFLSFTYLVLNMPEKKNKRVYNEVLTYFPYKIKKEFGGLDIVDKRTGKDLDVANTKVFIAYDELMKKWSRDHIELKGDELIIKDDANKSVKVIKLQNSDEKNFAKSFFKSPKVQ